MSELGERFTALVVRVLGPLVLGGPLRPVRPLGATLGLSLGRGLEVPDADLRSQLDVARVRRARLLAPLDVLPPPGADDFALTAGVNDLLAATHHDLVGVFRRERPRRVLAGVVTLAGQLGGPRDALSALSRHATLARLFELVRVDRTVSWWAGHTKLRGEAPPARLLAWRGLRRVQVHEARVGLDEMASDRPEVPAELYDEAIEALLSCSPLTDVASAARPRPVFRWSRTSLALIASPAGALLAERAARRGGEAARGALEQATRALPAGHARELALSLVARLGV